MPRDSLPSGLLDSCPIEWSHPLNSGIAGWWGGWPNVGWSGGAIIRDLSGLSGRTPRNGVQFGGPTWRGSCGSLKALRFAQSNTNRADLGSSNDFNYTEAITLELLARYTATDTTKFHAGKGFGGGVVPYAILNLPETSQNIGFGFYNGSSWSLASDSVSLSTRVGQWYHIVGTYDRANVRLYINGQQVASTAATAALPTNTLAISIGSANGWISSQGIDIASTAIFNRAMSASSVAARNDQFRRGLPDVLRWVRPWSYGVDQGGGGGGTFTGTGALTSSSATLAASATFATATYTGTGTLTSVSAELAASATFATATYTGTGTLTSTSAELAASATVTNPVYTGTSSLTSEPATLAASAVFATAVYQGTGTLTSEPATLAASATFTAPTYTGTGTLTSASAELAASATVTNPTYTGTSALESVAATLAATAIFAAEVYQGTGTLVSGSAVLASSATFTAPVYTGTSSLTSGSATLSATALFAMAIYQATATLTSGSTTLAATATFTEPSSIVGGYVGGTISVFPRVGGVAGISSRRAFPY